jgi:hypothetical protein
MLHGVWNRLLMPPSLDLSATRARERRKSLLDRGKGAIEDVGWILLNAKSWSISSTAAGFWWFLWGVVGLKH